jgi:hypothetical protein
MALPCPAISRSGRNLAHEAVLIPGMSSHRKLRAHAQRRRRPCCSRKTPPIGTAILVSLVGSLLKHAVSRLIANRGVPQTRIHKACHGSRVAGRNRLARAERVTSAAAAIIRERPAIGTDRARRPSRITGAGRVLLPVDGRIGGGSCSVLGGAAGIRRGVVGSVAARTAPVFVGSAGVRHHVASVTLRTAALPRHVDGAVATACVCSRSRSIVHARTATDEDADE